MQNSRYKKMPIRKKERNEGINKQIHTQVRKEREKNQESTEKAK